VLNAAPILLNNNKVFLRLRCRGWVRGVGLVSGQSVRSVSIRKIRVHPSSVRPADDPARNHVIFRLMEQLHLTIEGMTCQHCVRAVDGRLRKTPGVEVTQVTIGSADVQYDPARTNVDEIAEAIADEGYTAFQE
jgi:copper chaperone